VKLAVKSADGNDLSYVEAQVAVVPDDLPAYTAVDPEVVVHPKEYVQIGDKLYQNMGVNRANHTLQLLPINIPQDEVVSTQIGYQAFPYADTLFQSDVVVNANANAGKYVLLNFWATWCSGCKMEMPTWNKVYATTDTSKFQMLGICAESDSVLPAEAIVDRKIQWPQLLVAKNDSILTHYKVDGYPSNYLIDPNGVIVARDLRGKELEKVILELGLVK
jgi:thiol-disulfide isomerase/thioredoxin